MLKKKGTNEFISKVEFLYSCLRNPMDRGTWQATVHGFTKESDMTERLNHNNNDKIILKFLKT